MAGPTGALASSFKISRGLQIVSMIAIIGMTANFVSQMVSASVTPPSVLVATLSVVCIAVLYCAVTVILFLDNLLPYLVSTVVDGLFLIALLVVAVVVGKPVSYLDCKKLADVSTATSSALDFTSALGSSLSQDGGKIDYARWIGTSTATCYEMKSIWGLSIALCVLFAFSAICSVGLWRRAAAQAQPPKDEA
ncbi:hypothetical protein DV738_g1951, partial [Chaetothyriales sp. CBS 135597]